MLAQKSIDDGRRGERFRIHFQEACFREDGGSHLRDALVFAPGMRSGSGGDGNDVAARSGQNWRKHRVAANVCSHIDDHLPGPLWNEGGCFQLIGEVSRSIRQ